MHVISASRKTDIPAFYTEWFMNRIRAGYCHWLNPYSGQVYRISLKPDECVAIVFWTRNPLPLLPYLAELTARGYHYYFLFTLMGYPPPLEIHAPALAQASAAFQRLSERLTPERVFWKYDPIVLSNLTPLTYHVERFGEIADQLKGYTQRCVYSWLTLWANAQKNLAALAGAYPLTLQTPSREVRRQLLLELLPAARSNGIDLYSCFSEDHLLVPGIHAGSCVDLAVLRKLTRNPHLELTSALGMRQTLGERPQPSSVLAAFRHRASRTLRALSGKRSSEPCRCRAAVDIGNADTCLFGCAYCLATASWTGALANQRAHDPTDSLLLRPAELRTTNLDEVARPYAWNMVQ